MRTIGSDDTSTATADLVAFTQEHNYNLTVVGLPKTADNDVYPLWQTAGAFTVAEEGAKFFAVYEISCNPSMRIVHEVMGRASVTSPRRQPASTATASCARVSIQ